MFFWVLVSRRPSSALRPLATVSPEKREMDYGNRQLTVSRTELNTFQRASVACLLTVYGRKKRLFLNLIANLQADILQLRLREGERLFQHNLGIRTPLRISPRLPLIKTGQNRISKPMSKTEFRYNRIGIPTLPRPQGGLRVCPECYLLGNRNFESCLSPLLSSFRCFLSITTEYMIRRTRRPV